MDVFVSVLSLHDKYIRFDIYGSKKIIIIQLFYEKSFTKKFIVKKIIFKVFFKVFYTLIHIFENKFYFLQNNNIYRKQVCKFTKKQR